jgi:hypothetical protein
MSKLVAYNEGICQDDNSAPGLLISFFCPTRLGRPLLGPNNGKLRLMRILISESAYLIWTLRCERVIQDNPHTPQSIKMRWNNRIDARIDIDRRLAKLKRNPAQITKVNHTWQPLLKNTHDLPPNWVTNLEVLVGIKPSRPPV